MTLNRKKARKKLQNFIKASGPVQNVISLISHVFSSKFFYTIMVRGTEEPVINLIESHRAIRIADEALG